MTATLLCGSCLQWASCWGHVWLLQAWAGARVLLSPPLDSRELCAAMHQRQQLQMRHMSCAAPVQEEVMKKTQVPDQGDTGAARAL
jgi:hypothetical protein